MSGGSGARGGSGGSGGAPRAPRRGAAGRRSGPRLLLGALVALLVVVAALFVRSAVSEPEARSALAASDAGGARLELSPELREVPRSAIRIGAPEPLARARHETRWAPVRRAVVARRAPRSGAPPVAPLGTKTPEGTTNLVLALDRAKDARGALWVRVRLPILPNGSTGWVPRAALGGYEALDTHLVVDRRRLTATLLRDGRPVLRAPVGIGQDRWPTPAGSFYVRNELTRYSSPTYGPVAFGTSARSATLTDWPAGGFIGIHGTDEPGRLPGRVSHGCIRMRNADILALARLMRVGTPLTIR